MKGARAGEAIRPLERAFYARNPRRVARELLGKVLIRQDSGRRLTARIVEVEAYLGANDPASHSYSGKTLRNDVLFGPPGYAYIYFIYGNHYCLNVSCNPDGKIQHIFEKVKPEGHSEEVLAYLKESAKGAA